MFKVIMVPVEVSPFETRALAVAARLARQFDTTLHLVRVLAPPVVAQPFPPMKAFEITEEALAEEREAYRQELEALGAEIEGNVRVRVNTKLMVGRVTQTLRDHAVEIGADMIVMSSHSRGGLQRLNLGSVTDYLIRDTHIPVLVVTVTAKEEKARALGADEFWIKPVDQARLLRKLGTIVANGTHGKLLVIDDDERARYLMRKHLEGGAYQLFEASSGPEGVSMAQKHRPHVILLDFLLREMNAFDVLDELKGDARTRDIPVIIITSHALEPDERKRLEADTEVILSKQSLSREIAINRIRDALRKAGVGVGSPQQTHRS